MSYTKGPWVSLVGNRSKPNDHVVVSVHPEVNDHVDLTEKHNAQLIAAAPELLEALEFLMQDQNLEPNLVSLIDALMITSRGKTAITKIRSAIAKAKGGAK
jgi:hypothetical protein